MFSSVQPIHRAMFQNIFYGLLCGFVMALYSFPQTRVRDSEMLRDIRGRASEFSDNPDNRNMFWAAIDHLFGVRSPAAIFFAVSTAIVYSIQTMPLGALSHVGEKSLERMPPAFADGYPSSTIAMIFFGVWVFASLNHASPSNILSRFGHSVRFSRSACFLRFVTAAAFGVTAIKMSGSRNNVVPAITHAVPPRSFFGGFKRLRDYQQSTKSFAYKVDCFHAPSRSIVAI